MPDTPNDNPIVWSAAANNFIQKGHSGFVDRLTGIESLTPVETDTGLRYRDQAGHFTPDPLDLIPSTFRTEYFNRIADSEKTSADVYSEAPPDGSGYTTLYILTKDDGSKVPLFIRSAIGDSIDAEIEASQAVVQVGRILGIAKGSPEGGSEKLLSMLSDPFHFITT